MDAFEYLRSLEPFGIRLGLENISRLCEALGDPQERFRSILVAGTNGKGSVTAMVERALRAGGGRTGRYTSPHLIRLEERFAIDGRPIDTGALRAAVARVRAAAESLAGRGRLAGPTFFEATTATAFELFRGAGVEVAVLEVGLGGRFDATNLVAPVAAAVTSIDLDHERQLGGTLADIAFEKAGIVRPGMTLVCGECKPEALGVIARVCRERGASLVVAGDGVRADAQFDAGGAAHLELSTPIRSYGRLRLALRGRHQVRNASVAVRLLESLETAGMTCGAEAIATGLGEAEWPGRLQLVPLGGGRRLLLDAAHNPAAASALAAYLDEAHAGGVPIVFGAMADKDTRGMLAALGPQARLLVLTRPSGRRALEPSELAREAAGASPGRPVAIEPDPVRAVARALTVHPLACVTGSIFLVGEILAALERGDAALTGARPCG